MKRTLIVDDNAANLYLLHALLQGHGHTVAEAGNGAEALEAARRSPPDLIISDLLMPVMDGYTLLREWKADPALNGIPFVVYTATYTEPKDEKLALDLGADAFIVKPAEPEVFMHRIEAVLEQAERGTRAICYPTTGEASTLKLYSEVLVNKLEKKTEELERRLAELQASEARIGRLNRLYAALSETNQAIVHQTDADALFASVCRTAVARGGFALAWVGTVDTDTGAITPRTWEGPGCEWFERIGPLDAKSTPRTPVQLAIAEERMVLSNDLLADPAFKAIHPALEQCGLRAGAACPLQVDGRIVAVLSLLSCERGHFDDSMQELVSEMAADVSYALSNFERERARSESERKLRESEQACRLAYQAIEASANGIMITDLTQEDGPIIYLNAAFTRITGYPAEEALGRNPRFLMGSDRAQIGLAEIRASILECREGQALLRNYRKDGSLFWNDLTIAPVQAEGEPVRHFVGVINDVTERRRYEEELERSSTRDALTGLANRSLLHDRIERAISFARRQDSSVAILLLDADQFKRINTSLGHQAGDAVLQAIAERLNECIRERDALARIGGDEFVALLTGCGKIEEVTLVAGRMLEALARPLTVGGREITLGASIGISIFPQDGGDAETLLRNADAAMHGAKAGGRNALRFYTADMNAEALRKLEIESRLRLAIERDQLMLHFQPIVDLRTGTTPWVEALLRWQDEDGHQISPAEFIPLAEQAGLMSSLGAWVLERVCSQIRAWNASPHAHVKDLGVAVNLSARQLHDPGLVGQIRNALRDSNVAPRRLTFEITESAVMDNAEEAATILADLKGLGVALAVDDFGTGYSSLAYLHRFPIDELKIDRSFIVGAIEHPDSTAIINGIVGLARNLGLRTVAEGVETEAQRQIVSRAGCDAMQGYLFSRPVPPDQLADAIGHRCAL